MHEFTKLNRLTFALILLFAITSCGKSAETESDGASLLQYVPADTPYLFSNTEPLPDDVMDVLEPGIDSMLKAYGAVLQTILNMEHKKDQDDGEDYAAELAVLRDISDELTSLMTIEGLRAAGVGRESTLVVYGEGLLPVFRMRLTDSALMEETIARIEAKAGTKMPTGSISDQSYRYAGDEDAKVILALVGNDLVLTMVPNVHSDELLKSVLGLTKPEKSMADSGQVNELLAENNFEPYYLFFVDFTRLASTFLDEQSGSNAELLALTEFDASALSDVCKEEIREMAGIAPRIVAGYTDINKKQISSNFIFELRQDIAAGLEKLVAPVQGLGTAKGGLFSFGMSLDLVATREFYSARLDAMEADPFECEEFAEMNAGVAQGRELLKQPIPPIAYSVKGFLAVVDALDGMDIATKQPPTSVDASFLLATDNASGLIAMGAMFSPEIAALDLKADGKPQKLNLPPVSPALSEAFIAMTEDSLVISVGEGGADRIVELLNEGYVEPLPFMGMSMDTGQYYDLMADSMMVAPANDPENEMPPELTAAMADVMRSLRGMFGETTMSINFTDRGVEIPTTVNFAEDE